MLRRAGHGFQFAAEHRGFFLAESLRPWVRYCRRKEFVMRARLIHGTGIVVVLAVASAALAQGATWTGDGGAPWSVADNWDPKTVPNNAPPTTYYNVTINKSGPIVDGGFSIAGLSIDGTLALNEGSNLGFQAQSGGVTVSGTGEINIAPAAPFSPTSIVLGSNVTLNGGGRITMGGTGTARIVGGPVSLTNNSWTIAGEGRLLEGFASLENFGTISASSGTLLVRAAGLNNGNIMRAIPSGTLHIVGSSGTFDNVGGTVLASGALVQFSGNLHVTGGTLRSDGSGSFETIASGGGTHRLRNLSNESDFWITGSTVEIQDTITNSGIFNVTSGSSMRAIGVATLNGGGVVSMNAASFGGSGSLPRLILDDGIIAGNGDLGLDHLDITVGTSGMIRAEFGRLFVDPSINGIVNNGTLLASAGTLLLTGGGPLNNTNGRIEAEGFFTAVVFGGDTGVFGGTIEATNNATAIVGFADRVRFANLTINGPMVLEGGSTTVCSGQFLGNYRFFGEPSAVIEIDGSARFGPFGQILPDGMILRPRNPFAEGPGASLVNDGLIEGTASIGAGELQIENNGTIRAANDDQITINPGPAGLANTGVIEARGTGTVILDGTGGGTLTQQAMGTVAAVDATSTVRTAGNPTLSGGRIGAGSGSVILSGTTTLENIVSDARLYQASSGSLIISGSVVSNGSLTIPSTSRMMVGGSLTLGTGGTGHYNNGGSIIIGSTGSFNNAGSGPLLDAGIIVGAGTVTVQTGGTLRANSIRQNRLTINDGATAQLKHATTGTDDPSRIGTLTIGAAPAALDITNRVLILDQSGPAQLASLSSLITAGYSGGTWNGPGINSSDAAAATGHGIGFGEASAIFTGFPATFFGQTIDSTTLLVSFTRYGDANLDRLVNSDDFNRFAANFGLSGRTWTQGDFNYDTIVNSDDFNLLAGNFGLSAGPDGVVDPADWAALAAVVPEPGLTPAVLLGAAMYLPRRIQRSKRNLPAARRSPPTAPASPEPPRSS